MQKIRENCNKLASILIAFLEIRVYNDKIQYFFSIVELTLIIIRIQKNFIKLVLNLEI